MMLLNYFRDTADELKKLHTPSKKETHVTTITIIITIIVFSSAVLLADFIIAKIMGLIFGL
ncbi:MAG: preprotein translocase subunit SecE [Rickettsiales bacterium]|nr:preprotein translocase subunit SecE [Rickettsiales bacterium]